MKREESRDSVEDIKDRIFVRDEKYCCKLPASDECNPFLRNCCIHYATTRFAGERVRDLVLAAARL